MTTAFWDDRYSQSSLVYGQAANDFLVATLQSRPLPKNGTALDLGAGEGRNALYLASRGYDTLAVDQSPVGMQKAARLAKERNLPLRTQAADLSNFDAPPASFDVISSIFVHLPKSLRAKVHHNIATWLRPSGLFILEAYTPAQLTRNTGGPKDPALLAGLDEVVTELKAAGLNIEHAQQLVRVVKEGEFHTGEAEVVEVVAMKM